MKSLMSGVHTWEKKDVTIDAARRLAARTAIDTCVDRNTMVIGIGYGQAILPAVERLAERFRKEENLSDLICIPSSFQAKALCKLYNLPCSELDRYPDIDVTFDCMSEVDNRLMMIKGDGGSLLQEKIVATFSRNFVIIADYSQKSVFLGEQWHDGVPVEVSVQYYIPIMHRIIELFGGTCKVRMAKAKAGPVVTDQGNFILDWIFPDKLETEWIDVHSQIKKIPGVWETGLYIRMADKIYIGVRDGTVKVQQRY